MKGEYDAWSWIPIQRMQEVPTLLELAERRRAMEKYGYEKDKDLTKKAAEAGKCPQCGSPLSGNPPVCPKCGSEPFEKKEEGKK